MKERPILFSAPMVRAILEGRKTQTRRACKGARELSRAADWPIDTCPYGAVGDRLWVRERFSYGFLATGSAAGNSFVHFHDGGQKYFDGAYYDPKNHPSWDPKKLKWKSSIHMPRWASRITLEVTGVRVERLKSISDKEAIAEGLYTDSEGLYDWDEERLSESGWVSPAGAYWDLWEHINGKGSVDANPWVWVIEFKRVTQ